SLGFLVELAFRPRPEPTEAALHLLGQLVGRPRTDVEQAQQGVRGRREGAVRFLHGAMLTYCPGQCLLCWIDTAMCSMKNVRLEQRRSRWKRAPPACSCWPR